MPAASGRSAPSPRPRVGRGRRAGGGARCHPPDPSSRADDERDLAICAALDDGNRRVEVASRLGVSKSYVDRLAQALTAIDAGL